MSRKVAIIILADSDTNEGPERVVNALVAAGKYDKVGDEVKIVFTGTGTKWPSSLEKSDHPTHGLLKPLEAKFMVSVASVQMHLGNLKQ